MNSNFVMMLTAITLFVALVIPVSVSAQEQPVTRGPQTTHRYRLIDLGTLGGPSAYLACCGGDRISEVRMLNNHGCR